MRYSIFGTLALVLSGLSNMFAQTSVDSVTITFRAYVSSSTTTFVPGQFNNWGPNSSGTINSGAPSQMSYDSALACWIKTYTFKIHDLSDASRDSNGVKIDSMFQYKFNAGGSSSGWFSDPLNQETNPQDNNNSVLRLTNLFWFQMYRQDSSSYITKITAGLIHANSDSIASIMLTTGATSEGPLTSTEIVSDYDTTKRILSHTFSSPILKSDYMRLVGYTAAGDSVVYEKEGYAILTLEMPAYAKHGVTLPSEASGDSATFRLRLSGQGVVFLYIAPSGQSPATADPIAMRKDALTSDNWWTNVALDAGTYEYQYGLESKLVHDPWGREVGQYGTKFTVGAAGLTADDYVWQSTEYERPQLNKVVIYELNVGEFAGGYYNKTSSNQGTFLELASLMGHFDSLGVNAIELMPVNDYGSIGKSGHSWGYDLNSYFALEPGYGTPRNFKALVDSAHSHGIAVIVDVVFNHLNETSALWQMQPSEAENPYFKTLTPLHYNEDGLGFFKDMDHWTPETQELVYESLKMWIDEYKVDGFRYDFTQGIGWKTSDTTVGILGWANRIHNEYGGQVYQIAEHLPESPALIYYSGLTSGWHDSFRDEVFDEARFRNTSLTEFENLVLGLSAYGSNDTPSSPSSYGTRIEPVNANVNHDEQSLIYEMQTFQGVSPADAVKRDKLYATFMFASLGVPMLWQGMEWAEPRGWSSDGLKLGYRPVQWSRLSTAEGLSHFRHYQALAHHRLRNPALYDGELRKLAKYTSERVLVWGLEDSTSGAKVMIVANLSNSEKTVSNVPWLATGVWYDVFNESEYNVSATPVDSFTVPAYTAKVYSNKSNTELGIPTSVEKLGDNAPREFRLLQNYPNPFNPATNFEFRIANSEFVQLRVYDILGREVVTLVNEELRSGVYHTQWDARNQPSGVYFYRIQAGDFVETKKMLLLK
ncbi:MAG: T9SS type A sorting domain-containing protein [Ignavibacteriae bacterium]|nr:T9SS type A sorting domain-containing protein [Ignavibacteriota bacterium]